MNAALNFLNTGMRSAVQPAMQNIVAAAAPQMAQTALQGVGQNAAGQVGAQVGATGLNLEKLLGIANIGNQLWQTMQAGNNMKFQQNMAKEAFGMQKEIHQENKEDRQARRDVDFTAGLVS